MKYLLILFAFCIIFSFLYFSHNEKSYDISSAEFFPSYKNLRGPDQRPYEWDYIKRTFPYYNADPRAYIDALKQAHQIYSETRLSKGKNNVQWQFAGPFNVGGRVVDTEFDPSSPNIVYAGFATGGVFKSFDAGNSWVPIFDSLAVLTIGDIAIDPSNSDIIYVGTGEANGGHNNFPGGGMFKSTDAGVTWIFLGLENTISIGRVLVNPINSNIVYFAAVGSYFSPNPERGVYKSTDGGNTWNQSLFVSDTTGAIDIIMDPVNPNRMMAAMWERVRRPLSSHLFGSSSGVYVTTDGGDNWNLISPSTGLPNSGVQNVGRIGLALSQSSPDIVYALYTDGFDILSLFKSTDFGNSWVNVDTDNELRNSSMGFSWYFGQVRVSPVNPDIVYVMDVAFMRSTDGGNNWPIQYGYSGPSQLHVDHHALAFSPANSNYVISGNDGGINISTDGGTNFSNPKQIPATQFYEIGLDATNPFRLYGGTQDNGTNRTPDGGLNNWENIFGGDGFYVIVDYTNPNIIYAESQNGNLAKSTNGGSSWINALNGINSGEPKNWSTPVIMDPNTPEILYYGTNYLYRTTNGAQSWTKISPQLTDWVSGRRLGTITTVAVAPTNSQVIYVGTDDAHVWVSTNNGTNWNEISSGLPVRWVTRIVVDPTEESIVYVTFSGLKWKDPQSHVFRSTNYGSSWSDISSNLPDAPVNAFAVDNNNASVLYVGNDVGMYVSFNAGQSWEALGEGLPILPVGDIKIHPTANFLAAGTYGRSMYKIDLNLVTSVTRPNSNTIARNFVLNQNYPNPFNPSTKITYTIPTSPFNPSPYQGKGNMERSVILKVYDILGNEITTLVNEEKTAGNYEVQFDATGLASGVYYYSLTAGGFYNVKKMLYLK